MSKPQRMTGGVVLVALAGLLAGCGSTAARQHVAPATSAAPTPSAAASSPTPSTHSAVPAPSPTRAPDVLAGMTLQQEVGQLFMVGSSAKAVDPSTLYDVTALHVGNVFLSGRSYAGVAATARVVAQFKSRVSQSATAGLPLLVATDQEGGEVQVLNGPGFSSMPSGLQQGGMSPSALQQAAATWGRELRAAGVNMDLAPVAGLVPSAQAAAHNPPIGEFYREYGFDPATIDSHVGAFSAGMRSAGVVPVVKHFPGLGYVDANTDTSRGVTDTVTTPQSASVGVFGTQIANGAPVVMVSTAVYSRIDPSEPAAFSSIVVNGLLRGQLGFKGVVITDDLSAAVQVSAWSPASRAILALEAGDDIVLVSAEPSLAPQMIAAVVAKAQTDPAFAAIVTAAARRVVELKEAQLG